MNDAEAPPQTVLSACPGNSNVQPGLRTTQLEVKDTAVNIWTRFSCHGAIVLEELGHKQSNNFRE